MYVEFKYHSAVLYAIFLIHQWKKLGWQWCEQKNGAVANSTLHTNTLWF
jgi:hypothetical protein